MIEVRKVHGLVCSFKLHKIIQVWVQVGFIHPRFDHHNLRALVLSFSSSIAFRGPSISCFFIIPSLYPFLERWVRLILKSYHRYLQGSSFSVHGGSIVHLLDTSRINNLVLKCLVLLLRTFLTSLIVIPTAP